VQEHISAAIEHYEVAPPSTEEDVRATCAEFGLEPSGELVEFATELDCNGNELWLRIDDGSVILYNQEEADLVLVATDLRGLVAGLEPL
jgi:hypothetical protein